MQACTNINQTANSREGVRNELKAEMGVVGLCLLWLRVRESRQN